MHSLHSCRLSIARRLHRAYIQSSPCSIELVRAAYSAIVTRMQLWSQRFIIGAKSIDEVCLICFKFYARSCRYSRYNTYCMQIVWFLYRNSIRIRVNTNAFLKSFCICVLMKTYRLQKYSLMYSHCRAQLDLFPQPRVRRRRYRCLRIEVSSG